MHWIFLSPHHDDAVMSCGGLIAERVNGGDSIEIWTICAGDPPDGPLSPFASQLHERWDTGLEAMDIRRREDISACKILGAAYRHFPIPDCIYRRDPFTGDPLIKENDDLFQPLPESQANLVKELRKDLLRRLPSDCHLVAPMTLGNHIDHQLVRLAAESLDRDLWFYADYPYAVQKKTGDAAVLSPVSQIFSQSISPAGLRAWQDAVAAYKSQISTFWGSLSEMKTAIRDYWRVGGGCKLWHNLPENP